MNNLRKWIANADFGMGLLGAVLIYFSEHIVLFFFPLDPVPGSVVAMLIYMTLFTIAAFWLFKGIVYYTIKIYWDVLYQYFESQFKLDFAELKPIQRLCVSVGFYLSLLLALAIIYSAAVATL